MTVGVRQLSRIILAVLALTLATLASPGAKAQDAEAATRDAGKHFQRGVSLYSEADYRAALIEFKRAYALAPNAAVLYNVGQTEYQLQDYAGALTTFERYLSESSPAESHRADVEASVQVLRTRVGRLSITTVPAGADVSLDDQPIGKTPLDGPALLVSIGRRRVTASMAGRPPVTRLVDVAAEDSVSVILQMPPANVPLATASRPEVASEGPLTPASGGGSALRAVGWIATGTLAAGAVTFGLLAVKGSSDLKNARSTFPTMSGTLSHDANLVSTYSALADSLTAAAIVVGGITLVSALSSSPSSAPPRTGARRTTSVGIGPASASFQMTF
jgi:tetratricopeptide (TPR) repeat protein